MEITKEYIEKKIKEYEALLEQHRNNLIATDGAIQALKILLKDM